MNQISVSFREYQEVLETIKGMAKQEDRSISNMIVILLKEALKNRKGER